MIEQAGTPQIISRAEAKRLGLKRYYTGKPCKHNHAAERFVTNGSCVACAPREFKAWYSKNGAAKRAAARVWKGAHSTRVRELKRASYARHAPVIQARRRLRQTEAGRHAARVRALTWAATNPERANARNAARRANKLRATPRWLTFADRCTITEFYRIAEVRERLLNRKFHVDHIVPLRGKSVCGLHTPWNLRVIPAEENLAKSNKLLEAA